MSRKRFKNDAERQTERRVRFVMKGLTTQGKPRKRNPHFVNWGGTAAEQEAQLATRRASKLQKNLAYYYRLAAENKAKGLRVDGKPFRRLQTLHAWQHLRATITVPPTCIDDIAAYNKRNYA